MALYALLRGPIAGLVAIGSISGVLVAIGLALVLLGVPIAFAIVIAVFAAVMNAGGITERQVDLATRLFGHLRGGLGHVNVLSNTMIAGVSGSSMADAASIGKIMVPALEKRGYPRPFSCALTSAPSVIANLIPPSLGLIIYGALASVSGGALFVATIVPGLMVAAALAGVVAILSMRQGYGGNVTAASGRERWRALVTAHPAPILPVLIVGGVRFGFTATEAGATAFV